MTVYNMSFMNSTNPVDTVVAINTASGGIIGAGICVIIYFIIIKASTDNNYGIGTALLTSSFILCIISGILLGIGNVIPDYVMGINVAVFVASIFIKVFGEK